MKCFYCDTEVRWNNDFDTEDTHPESEHEIVSMYECGSCKAWYEVYTCKKDKEKNK
jgi:hypothetical protein|tara:strand:+ start:335 stop:502 length:168 start_codon:yes stop_codon:yes gene_type:complete